MNNQDADRETLTPDLLVPKWQWFHSIMGLQGVDEFKSVVQRLRKFQLNKEKFSMPHITLPNYLWVARRGGGVSTCLNAFAEYLYAAKIIEFTGIVKHLEFKLAYIAPDAFFSELTRLNNTISEIAGHHRYFRGLVGINIDEWIQHTNENYFYKLLDYISSKNDRFLTVFYVHADNKRAVSGIESSLSSRIRFETIHFRFPNTSELIEFIETKYFLPQKFSLAEDAKTLLSESIEGMLNGKHFNGFITIKQLANDIMYNLLTLSNITDFTISADMLSGFSKDSAYIKRIKAFVGTNSAIGFGSMEEYIK